MSAYREPDPPPPEPPDPDVVAMERMARRRHRIVKWGPYVAMLFLLGIVAVTMGVGFGIFAAVALLVLRAMSHFGDAWHRFWENTLFGEERVRVAPSRAKRPRVRAAPPDAEPEVAPAEAEDDPRKQSL